MNEAVLGLDIGTGSVKVVATDAAGTVLGEGASRAITTLATSPGAAEQDADEILGAVHEAVIATVRQIPDHRVVVVAAAAQSGSVLPIGENDTRGRLVTWMDSRSARVVDRWSADDGAMIRRISGWSPSTGLGLSTIAWMREDAPTAFASVSRFAAADDLVTHHLTGEWSTNPTNASGMQLMEVATGHWSADLCRFAGVRPEQLSTITTTGAEIGRLSRPASQALGVPGGVSVVAGGHDQACSLLALGVDEPGAVLLSAGTAWVLTAVTARCDPDSASAVMNLSPHCLPGRWSGSRSLGGLGATIGWALGELHLAADDLPELLQDHRPVLADPFFVPAVQDQTRTAWGHFSRGPAGCPPAVSMWAVLESAAFEVRRGLDTMSAAIDTPRTLVAVGRGASPVVTRLVASLCGVTVIRWPERSWPAMGAAQIAASALGWARPAVDPGRSHQVEPDPALADALAARYAHYRHLVEGG